MKIYYGKTHEANPPRSGRQTELTIEEMDYVLLACDTMHGHDFSVEDYISARLIGKLKIVEAKLVAIELGYLINSAAYGNGSTIEERAVNRELGSRLAKRMSQTIFDDSDEAAAFVRGIENFVEEDICIEKSRYLRNTPACRTSYPIAVSYENLRKDPLWCNVAYTAVEIHEREASRLINDAAASLDEDTVNERLALFLGNFKLLQATMTDNVLDDIERVLEIHRKMQA